MALGLNGGRDMEPHVDEPAPDGTRRLAWDGISLLVPSNWELANFRTRRRDVSRIEVEDEYALRLEAEWVRTEGMHRVETLLKRYVEASKPLTVKAEEEHPVTGLPGHWRATHFVFKETAAKDGVELRVVQHELITAFYLGPEGALFGFFLLHVLPEDVEDPVDLIRLLAAGFRDHHRCSEIPWQLFDIGFTTPRDFELTRTAFDIGAKHMAFAWKRRRFFLWVFSCADMLLKGGVQPAAWAASYLNSWKGISGITFRVDPRGGIAWRRSWAHPFGHREEIWRWCFRYHVGCRVDEEANQLVAWIFHHRGGADLEVLPKVAATEPRHATRAEPERS